MLVHPTQIFTYIYTFVTPSTQIFANKFSKLDGFLENEYLVTFSDSTCDLVRWVGSDSNIYIRLHPLRSLSKCARGIMR